MMAPIKSAISAIGPFVARGIGEENYKNTMRKFGGFVDDKLAAQKLKPVADGQSVGDTFYNGMMSAYNYMKNGGAPAQTTAGDSGATGANSVEKNEVQQTNQAANMSTNYY